MARKGYWRDPAEPGQLVIESSVIYRQHANGKVLCARPEIMGHPDAIDVTAIFPAAQTSRETG